MSKAKFTAAQEFIKEKQYDQARLILKSIDHPKAQNWLEKLDQIDPPLLATANQSTNKRYVSEHEEYYREENRARRHRRMGKALQLIFTGIGAIVIAGGFTILPTTIGKPLALSWFTLLMVGFGLLAIFVGVIEISHNLRKHR